MMKMSGKPNADPPLRDKIIEEIYSPQTSLASEGIAKAVGEQLCVPVMKEEIRKGKMPLKE